MEVISKTDNRIIYSVFGVPMLVLIGFAVYTTFFGPARSELIRKDHLSENFSGRVDSLYFDERNHNVKYAVLNDGQLYPIYRNWERQIGIGDSLFKKKGSFLVEVYKRNKTKLTLDYRNTYKK